MPTLQACPTSQLAESVHHHNFPYLYNCKGPVWADHVPRNQSLHEELEDELSLDDELLLEELEDDVSLEEELSLDALEDDDEDP